ncbi:ornithine cyclodeaminase family protein [Streptomyces sp. DT24]|uniref:ornithine cyclodeaminase family protein n=1 Tax=unclassified Streptomyces TaxID=2593676 RepID=UPI0023B98317|nr:ornithine cyclodeaminase family protein [Streptomyces sp. AM 4-1-1]WEH36542.1 ornithine cyclodeaminase family protein [Streptomyces sp. AM 4-1-1]
MSLPLIGAADIEALGPAAAVDALEEALREGLDPETVPARSNLTVPGGELLLMPATTQDVTGVKIAGVAPGNAALGLPRITGSYLLLDGPTLVPLALLDGAALTTLRTPAVSALAVRHLTVPSVGHLVIFGTGPQAYGHLTAVLAERPVDRLTVIGRTPERVASLVAHARTLGLRADEGGPEEVATADLVLCCTTSRTPLFDGASVRDGATVVAVGSHLPDARETDSRLVARSIVLVEARSAALAEAGDLLVPIAEGAIAPEDIAGNLADLVSQDGVGTELRKELASSGRPRFFKSVGMGWEDLAIAAAVHRRLNP